MITFSKLAMVAVAATAFALSMETPSQAAWSHQGGREEAAAVGFGAGAIVGADADGIAYVSNDHGSDDAYDSFAYAPAPNSGAYGYSPAYRNLANSSNTNEFRCMMSPASQNYVPCDNNR